MTALTPLSVSASEELVAVRVIGKGERIDYGGNVVTRSEFEERRARQRPAHPFGLDHPTWPHPDCFHYDTAEAAWAAIEKVYGPDSAHIVVGPVPRKVHVEPLSHYPDVVPDPPERPDPLPDPVVPSS